MIADLCTVTDVAVSGYERSNVKFAGPESEERGLRFLSLFNIITFLQMNQFTCSMQSKAQYVLWHFSIGLSVYPSVTVVYCVETLNLTPLC